MGWYLPFVDHMLPVNIRAPWVTFYSADLPFGDSPPGVLVEHQFEQVSELIRYELTRIFQLPVKRTHEHLVLICRIKWR